MRVPLATIFLVEGKPMALIKGVKDEYLILAGAAIAAASLIKINIAPITLGGLSGGSSSGSGGSSSTMSPGYTFVPAAVSASPVPNLYPTDVEGLAALGAAVGTSINTPATNTAWYILTHNNPWFNWQGI